MPTTCSVTNLVLDAGLPHVTYSVNTGVWHQYPPCTLEIKTEEPYDLILGTLSRVEDPPTSEVEEGCLPFLTLFFPEDSTSPEVCPFSCLAGKDGTDSDGPKTPPVLPHPVLTEAAMRGWALAASIHWAPGNMAPTSSLGLLRLNRSGI